MENESISEGEIIPKTIYFNEKEYMISHLMVWPHYYKKKILKKEKITLELSKIAIKNSKCIKLNESTK